MPVPTMKNGTPQSHLDDVDPDGVALALVWADGGVESAAGSRGGRFLEHRPPLLDLVRATLTVGADAVAFVWLGPRRDMVWARICVTQDSPTYAAVTMRPLVSLPYGLTLRELDVLTLVVAGMTNAEIAERLHTSPRTVTTHVDRLLTKLDAGSRTAAATVAVAEGLVLLPPPGGPEGFERFALGKVAAAASGAVPTRHQAKPARPVHKAPMVLGTILPLTGPGRDDGVEMLRGSQLAADEINARGGVNGRRVVLAVQDVDVNDPDKIRDSFTALAEQEVDAVTSGYLGRQDVAHEVMAEYGRPYLHAATLNTMVERVKDDPGRYGKIFQVCPSDVLYGAGFVNAITELRARRAWHPHGNDLLVLHGNWPMGDLGIESAAALADRHGWRMRPVVPVGASEADWIAVARAVRNDPPAAMLIGHYFVDGTVAFVRELMKDPPPTLLYALYSPSVPSFRDDLGGLADGLLWATVSGTYSDALGNGFAQRFKASYGQVPGRSHAGIAYDRTNVIADAWARCSNAIRNPRAVSEQLRLLVHRGVNGSYQFAHPGQAGLAYPDVTMDPSIGQAHLVFQIQDGRHQILAPGPYANTEFQLPSWLNPPLR